MKKLFKIEIIKHDAQKFEFSVTSNGLTSVDIIKSLASIFRQDKTLCLLFSESLLEALQNPKDEHLKVMIIANEN